MKYKIYKATSLIIATVFLTFFSVSHLKADDVYNFYFQKAPGPVTVNQGGVPPSAVPAPSPVPQAITSQGVMGPPPPSAVPPATPSSIVTSETSQISTKVEVKKEESKEELKHWEILVGTTTLTTPLPIYPDQALYDYVGNYLGSTTITEKQWYLGAQYNFNRYLGIQAGVMQLQDRPVKLSGSSSLDVGGNLIVTPIHIDIFGADVVDVGAVFGGSTVPLCDSGWGANCVHMSSWFYGFKVDINFSKVVSLNIMSEQLGDQQATQINSMIGIKL